MRGVSPASFVSPEGPGRPETLGVQPVTPELGRGVGSVLRRDQIRGGCAGPRRAQEGRDPGCCLPAQGLLPGAQATPGASSVHSSRSQPYLCVLAKGSQESTGGDRQAGQAGPSSDRSPGPQHRPW